jgi:hypothetical protein
MNINMRGSCLLKAIVVFSVGLFFVLLLTDYNGPEIPPTFTATNNCCPAHEDGNSDVTLRGGYMVLKNYIKAKKR